MARRNKKVLKTAVVLGETETYTINYQKPIPLRDLKDLLSKNASGLIFCFGTSFTSQLIKAKTRLYTNEQVPSHVAVYHKGFIYESTTADEHVGVKYIPPGVRRWLVTDFIKVERKRNTNYVFIAMGVDIAVLERYIHYPYGIDTIVDYMFKDKSNGHSKGLICSQYANYATKLIDQECVTPAELYRRALVIKDKRGA